MDRGKTLKKAFQRGHLLNLDNPLYLSWIEKFIVDETKGDIGKIGDITSNAVILGTRRARARVMAREPGIVSGLEETTFLYKKNNIKVRPLKKDGDKIKKGDILLELEGDEKDLLKIERSALDLLQRMSGISTLTGDILNKIKHKVRIAPTRKTQWRYLDKKSVYIGGGLTHRLALWESILIKDNHLKAIIRQGIKNPIETALKRAWKKKNKANFIEIEVTSTNQAVSAARIFKEIQQDSKLPCLIMLDNMKPAKIKNTIVNLKNLGLYDHVLIEASGGINPKNIKNFSTSGIDVISMGYLTHSSHALDIKQYIL